VLKGGATSLARESSARMAYRHYIPLPDFKDSYVCATNAPHVERAVVFVHGFLGHSYETWLAFQELFDRPQSDPWWDGSDLYFFGYDSFNTSVSKTAETLLTFLDCLEPASPDWFMVRPSDNPLYSAFAATQLRETPTSYRELILVGHSLGGLVLRYALLQRLLPLKFTGLTPLASPVLQNARLRLFAPAINGSRPTGIKAFILSTAGPGALARALMRQSPSYNDMLPNGALIGPTRKSTQDLAEQHPAVMALRAEIVWGESETVVSDTKYDCDQVNDSRSSGKDHVTVCKPDTLASPAVRMVRNGSF
jgi:pimeloyl-ACP methyl ester carboxylesterase